MLATTHQNVIRVLTGLKCASPSLVGREQKWPLFESQANLRALVARRSKGHN